MAQKLMALVDAIKGNKKRIAFTISAMVGILLWNFILSPIAIAHGINIPVVTLDTFVDLAFALVGLI
ncbi:hypothetical protein G3G6_069 [Escherichia phage vB_EcoM-G3G6]|nr:hypothetical protein PYps55T_140 [Yersinia phage PYps55T]QOI70540.1 hypothetical protein PYps5T_139 [Yersinia phage PYps5T]QZI80274.1 hypothetical protein CHD2BS1_069 [Escherichia phage vB_EcoM-CHD2BS1]QZI80716.1 hypothetical protein CHD16UKE1_069 [Escherichia phage vB_EcoM-CHD16UKE1]QZI81456.1 hypothetical protein G3F6_069 [Escherichia phage vB_EcoM-G3F6]QZI82036.1 hypothetical protein G3F8_069 [Escherichia phage vB_EcoM-G3F8]QZI82326.1 hypothetical protein G3F9_069 [Escherichia phage vB_